MLLVLLVISFSFFLTPNASAQSKTVNVWGDLFSPEGVGFNAINQTGLGKADPRVIAGGIIQVILGFLGLLTVVLILYGGFLWMNSKGDPKKIETAGNVIKNAVIGLIIILSAFAIALFVTKVFIGVTGARGGSSGDDGGSFGGGGGVGTLGSGVVRSVYPEPGQRDVSRNTSIIITFKEVMKPESICASVINGKCAPNSLLLTSSVLINLRDAVSVISSKTISTKKNLNLIKVVQAAEIVPVEAMVSSVDNLTFVISPREYLGTLLQPVWYQVILTKDVKKNNGTDAFGINTFQWDFEVSDHLDLEPPQVVSVNLFPAPDNLADSIGEASPVTAAKGSLIIKAQPKLAVANSVTLHKNRDQEADLYVPDPKNNNCDGRLDVSINGTNPPTANLNYNGIAGRVNTPETGIVDKTIITSCGFKIVLDDKFRAGNSWYFDLTTEVGADWLQVGEVRYIFGEDVLIGASLSETASNLKKALFNNSKVSTTINGNELKLTAKVPGKIGNNIELFSNVLASEITILKFSGGVDAVRTVKINDRPDQPKNSLIQVTFNEPMNPMLLSGSSQDLARYLRVINTATNQAVAGSFRLSNEYKTVEFVPSEQCGTNGCGEPIYCLPPSSNLRVELVAAQLSAVCNTEAECITRAPYINCVAGVCTNPETEPYPEGVASSGLTDSANNSLDGNRNKKAEGPISFYNENKPEVVDGDNFSWSFWITDVMDITPPVILSVTPSEAEQAVDLSGPMRVVFNKLMSSGSLAPGFTNVKVDNKITTHQLINLRALDGSGIGYWINKSDEDISVPVDGFADRSTVLIQHQILRQNTKYRAQVGSGVKDVYQNCFKPCASMDCLANGDKSSCCLGAPSNTGSNATCP